MSPSIRGTDANSSTKAATRSCGSVPRAIPIRMASSNRHASEQLNVFVDATPISNPARSKIVPSATRVACVPG